MADSWPHYEQGLALSFPARKWGYPVVADGISSVLWLWFSIIQSSCSNARAVGTEISEDQWLVSGKSLSIRAQKTHLKVWLAVLLKKRVAIPCAAECLPATPLYTGAASLLAGHGIISPYPWVFSLLSQSHLLRWSGGASEPPPVSKETCCRRLSHWPGLQAWSLIHCHAQCSLPLQNLGALWFNASCTKVWSEH